MQRKIQILPLQHESNTDQLLVFKAPRKNNPQVQSGTTPCFKAQRGDNPLVKHIQCMYDPQDIATTRLNRPSGENGDQRKGAY